MNCDICKKEKENLCYQISYPIPITKSQQMRGCVPSGDVLLRVCDECKRPTHFHDPETTKQVMNLQGE